MDITLDAAGASTFKLPANSLMEVIYHCSPQIVGKHHSYSHICFNLENISHIRNVQKCVILFKYGPVTNEIPQMYFCKNFCSITNLILNVNLRSATTLSSVVPHCCEIRPFYPEFLK